LIDITVPQGPSALQQAVQTHPQLLTSDYLRQSLSRLPAATRQVMTSVIASTVSAQTVEVQSQTPPTQLQAPSTNPAIQAETSNSAAILAASQAPPTPQPPQTTTPPAVNPAAATIGNQPQTTTHGAHHHVPSNMLRVFKLQFDARRIICCSQTSTIVGWDFANGDEQIIEASRFFAPIE
jgi:F-box and WD-40 domain protein 1/11